MVDENEPLAQIETGNSVGATLDQAPLAYSSLEDSSPSLADVSLQTGQSLIQNTIIDLFEGGKATKETSTIPVPISTASQTFDPEIESANLGCIEIPPIQETIKVVKSSDGKHDVIEIATKNILPVTYQDQMWREHQISNPEDIIVDMKYQDAQKQENVTSELNIQHAAPQSFETVLVEPDDVTTEVVVDSDGTKRIIVRKLRRTLVTSRQTMQQHVSQLSTAVGDSPPVVQAFSEATMRGQQVTVTRSKPDGTVEMATKQTYRGKVITGTPGDQLNVEEYESTPQLSHRLIQGDIKDMSPRPPDVKEALVEGAEYRTKTSTVHAVVQQVSRKVIRKTRRIIRKITIVNGKEVTTEEVVEEPEEVEIDEQGIPHISINVVKSEDQKTFESSDVNRDTQGEGKSQIVKVEVSTETSQEVHEPAMEPQAKERKVEEKKVEASQKPKSKGSKKKKSRRGSATPEDSFESDKTYTIEEKVNPPEYEASEILSLYGSTRVSDPIDVINYEVKPQMTEKHELEYKPIEVNIQEPSSLAIETQTLIDSEKCAILQPHNDDSIESTTKDVSSLESTTIEDIPAITKASCKFEDIPVGTSFKTHDITLESGTVDVEQHTDVIDRRTVDIDDHFQPAITDIPQKEIQQNEIMIKSETLKMLEEERKQYGTETLKKEKYMDTIDKVDISLSIQNQEETDIGPLVSVESHIERPREKPFDISEGNVNIRLPAEKETIKYLNNKLIQTSVSNLQPADKETKISPVLTAVEETENPAEFPEVSKTSPVMSRKSRKKKKHREKKIHEKLSDEESSNSVVTTTIGDSIEIDVPQSDSSKHVTDQPEADVYEITESSDTFSAQKNENVEGDGYEADNRTTVDEMPPEFETDSGKKKKKKKKKQKPRTSKEDSIELTKSAVDEVELTDEVQSFENEETKIFRKPSKKKKRKKEEINNAGSDEALAESSDIQTNEADTQTVIETRDASAGERVPEIATNLLSPTQTSSESEQVNKFEREIQTLKVDERHTEIQTSPRPGLDIAQQTCLDLKLDIEDSSVQIRTPDLILKEEIALQTTPREEKAATPVISIPLSEADTQTTVTEFEDLEVQTSPAESTLKTGIFLLLIYSI